jgi:hypothetical protein
VGKDFGPVSVDLGVVGWQFRHGRACPSGYSVSAPLEWVWNLSRC